MKEIFYGVFQNRGLILTKNLVPGRSVYGEKLFKINNIEYRVWNPYRSKLCAAIKKGLKTFPFKKNSKILYLGASTGTTVSHLSDICVDGEIYGVEIAPQMVEKLVRLAEVRENIIPIHADARKPYEYEEVGEVEILYQDVAQPDQLNIFLRNSAIFLKKEGFAFFCVKSQSIDVVKDKKKVFDEILEKLKKDFDILEYFELEPYDKDHLFIVLRKK